MNKKRIDTIKFMGKRWKGYEKTAVFIVLLTLVNTAVVLIYPKILGMLINGLNSGVAMSKILDYILILIGSGIGVAFVYSLLQSQRLRMNLTLANKIREEIYFRFTGYGSHFFNKFRSGDVVARLINDMEQLTWFMSSGVFRGLEGFLLLFFGTYLLLKIDVMLTLISIVPLFSIITILLFATEEVMESKYKTVQKWVSKVNDFLSSAFGGIVLIKIRNSDPLFKEILVRMLKDRKSKEIDAVKFERFADTCYGVGIMLSISLFLFFGGKAAIDGRIDIGQFVAFTQYLIVLIGPMFSLSFFVLAYARSRAYIGRLNELLDEKNEEKVIRSISHKKVETSIDAENVTAGYGETSVLNNISLSIKAGEKVGIIGDVGSGKTTLIKTLMGMIPALDGDVTLDGINIQSISLSSIADMFGYAPQENLLFTASIRDNISFSDEKINDERIKQVVDIAQFKSELAEFAGGLGSDLGAGGKTVSGGQMQRISVARALVRRHCFYIFDDITSALDPETELALISKIKKEAGQSGILMVSYRPYTLSQMEKIILLRDGTIRAVDTHASLLERDDYYRDLLIFHQGS